MHCEAGHDVSVIGCHHLSGSLMDKTVDMTADLATRADIESLMRLFYERALADDLLGPKFSAIDMEAHIPKIVDFWQSTTIGGANYTASPFGPHKPLALQQEHFDRWLSLFEQTLNECFAGPIAEQIWQKAGNVANMMRFQLGLMKS